MFCREICEIFKKPLFTEHLLCLLLFNFLGRFVYIILLENKLFQWFTIVRSSGQRCSIRKAEKLATLSKWDFNTGVFLWIFLEFSRTCILKNIWERLLLNLLTCISEIHLFSSLSWTKKIFKPNAELLQYRIFTLCFYLVLHHLTLTKLSSGWGSGFSSLWNPFCFNILV